MAKNKEIKMTVVKAYGIIKEREYDKTNWETKKKEHHKDTLELRLVSWNDAAPKIDLRWWQVIDNNAQICKGDAVGTLTEEEATMLQFGLEQAIQDLAAASEASA